jgi:exodeoxyribonuclease VII large subunit
MNTPVESARRDVYSVSRLNSELRAVLEGSFPLLWVEGEISNLASPRSGHLYFSLKDANAQVRCALFRNRRQLLRFTPRDGEQILARARISVYEPRGDCQLIIEHLEPAGSGAAQRAFDALKAKLAAEGLFDAARKRPLPAFPTRIGVITSPSGAAIRDVLQVLARRAPHVRVLLYPAQVQGNGAPQALRDALQLALARDECDVLLLTRGGGSVEDLAAFNDEALARLVATSTIPVVSAVGHEIDFTICDFVADRRAPTPSAAAEAISPDAAALSARIGELRRRLARVAARELSLRQDRLARLAARLGQASPRQRLQQRQQRLDGLDLRLGRTVQQQLTQRRHALERLQQRLLAQSPSSRLVLMEQRLEGLARRLPRAWAETLQRRHQRLAATARALHAVSPLATMQRGFAVLRDAETGTVIHQIAQARIGSDIEGLVADGTLDLRVTARRTRD